MCPRQFASPVSNSSVRQGLFHVFRTKIAHLGKTRGNLSQLVAMEGQLVEALKAAAIVIVLR